MLKSIYMIFLFFLFKIIMVFFFIYYVFDMNILYYVINCYNSIGCFLFDMVYFMFEMICFCNIMLNDRFFKIEV